MKKFKRQKSTKVSKTPRLIWIDGYEANVPQRLGSGQVAFELLRNLEKIDQFNLYTILLPTPPMPDLPVARPGWQYRVLKPRQLWTRIGLPLALLTSTRKPDIFFSPSHYLPRFSGVKKVVTIFDLSYLHFPQMFEKKDLWKLVHWSAASIRQAKQIITISQFSKQDIVQNYQIEASKITVAYPGYNPQVYRPIKDQAKIKQVQAKYKIEGKYALFIGTVQPRKNLIKLIEAFTEIKDLKLVVVGKIHGLGKQAWKFEQILKRPQELGISERVIFTDFVPEPEMPYLVNGATVFVLPSLWEGFGIPAVEAMACGVPVVVSNVSSLPEAVGSAGILVNPNSTEQIAQAIQTIATDKRLRQQKIKQGLEQAKLFSWEKMAKIVLRVLEKEAA